MANIWEILKKASQMTKINFAHNYKIYSINLQRFNQLSIFLTNQQSNEKNYELLSSFEYSLDHSEENIKTFIQYFERQDINLTDMNVISINYLSHKFKVLDLIDNTEKYINDHYNNLINLFFSRNDNQHNYNTEKYEKILSKHLYEYLQDERLIELPISTIFRVMKLHYQENTKVYMIKEEKIEHEKQIVDFLFSYIKRKGINASILISIIELEPKSVLYVNEKLADEDNIDNEVIQTVFTENSSFMLKLIRSQQNEIKKLQKKINEQQILHQNQLSFMFLELHSKKLMRINYDPSIIYEGQFSNLSMTEFNIPLSIKTIEKKAFYECKFLKKIFIPQNTKMIKDKAFKGCSSLQQIAIFSSEITFGEKVFDGIKTLEITGKISNIPENMFNKCSSLIEIKIPSFIKSIKSRAFYRCTSLEKISIPSSVTSIDDFAFFGCSALKQISISSSNIKFGEKVFEGIETLEIIGDIKSIPYKMFYGCTSLKKFVIPLSITSINDYAFAECSSLEKISIPSSVTSIDNFAFFGCSSLKQISISSSNIKFGEKVFEGVETLEIIGGIKSIQYKMFYGCTSLRKIIIPPSITSINDYAFAECTSLEQISILSQTLKFGQNVFDGVSKLEIKGNIKTIPNKMFYRCKSLTQITIPSSVTLINNNAFLECSSLIQVLIPTSVNIIEHSAFSGCTLLEQITFETPSRLKSIQSNTFYMCTTLSQIKIPSSVTLIGDSAFSKCSSLKKILIPSSVTSIGNYTFSECSSLTEILIPSSVTSIGNYAFYKCSSLHQIEIPSSIISIDEYTFYGCASLTNIPILSSVKSIAKWAFAYCSSLLQISIPSVTYIGENAFNGCSSLVDLSIPSSDIEIRNDAFAGCSSLKVTSKLMMILHISIAEITDGYLSSSGSKNEIMNPTIRSKIIFGVAAIMKQLHKRNIIYQNLKLEKVLLDDKLEPKISSSDLSNVCSAYIKYNKIYYMAPEILNHENYTASVDVYAYGIFLYSLFSNNTFYFKENEPFQLLDIIKKMVKIGKRPIKINFIPEHYWELINNCWKQHPEERPTFEEITNILRDDKFALKEFDMETDLNQLHEYQNRIDIE